MLVAVNDHNPDRVQSLARGDWPSQLIVLTAGDQEFTKDNVDIDEILACWETTVRTALDDHGAPFVRLSAEATWRLTQLPSIADLEELAESGCRYGLRASGYVQRASGTFRPHI